ncbi:hypothetical protein N836_26330 [Leptolyngbya sp. Heron Island J]|uniref:hypothetical protein n=1 Tax=Leptolyngbya sp. Heron Island J TaxID=1385935 RepID=UPI0003B9DC22|nr:hypothetical protein [Leptolyngbya sp. Heron Island J]ESA32126.1 hypothetical protein N836_26330 [Leptolyngbya sp. Heron Island J]
MSLASAFTLSRLAADLTYDLSRAPEVPDQLTVQCAVSRGKIMVLLESPNVDTVPGNYVFAQVETLIRHRLEIDGLPVEAEHLGAMGEPIPIKVYLKPKAHPNPSAVHRFNWLLQDSSGPILLDDVALDDQAFEPLLSRQPEVAPVSLFHEDDDEVTGDLSEEEFLSGGDELLSSSGQRWGEALPSREEFQADDDQPSIDELLNLDGFYEQPPDDTAHVGESVAFEADEPWEPEADDGRIPSGLVAAGIGIAAVFGTLGYGLSRPCVIGECDRIQQAQALGDAALIALRDKPTPQTVLDMSEQLNTAVNTLKPIPPWSQHRASAQALLADYQGEAELLNTVAEAQENALVAAQESQDPPHPIAHWEGIAERWRETIAQLEEIPMGSPIYAEFVVPKLQEYRGNLTTIEGRIVAEQKAEENLNQAQLNASLAKDQAEIANTLSAWQTALESWDKSVKQIQQIPQGTMAHGEANKILTQYETDLAKVRTRYQQEQAADQFYNEAVRHAATARQYESEEQWTLAMLSWRDAITQMKGVPMGTSRHADGQTLLKNYEPALSRAQENLRLALRFEKAKENFARVCQPTFCQFGMKGGTVQLSLAENYDALADFSIADPNNRVSVPASDQMIVAVNQLLQEVINIGKRTQLPIELYGADGGFIARFSPELEGYVKTLVVR